MAGICATAMKKVLRKMTTPISPGPTGVCAFANGARMLDRGPSLKNDDRPRQARPPAAEHASERPARLLPAVGCCAVHA
jgi:hypothetical protein